MIDMDGGHNFSCLLKKENIVRMACVSVCRECLQGLLSCILLIWSCLLLMAPLFYHCSVRVCAPQLCSPLTILGVVKESVSSQGISSLPTPQSPQLIIWGFILLFRFGDTHICAEGLSPGSALRNNPCQGSGNRTGCQGSNPSQVLKRQVPFPVYYLSAHS